VGSAGLSLTRGGCRTSQLTSHSVFLESSHCFFSKAPTVECVEIFLSRSSPASPFHQLTTSACLSLTSLYTKTLRPRRLSCSLLAHNPTWMPRRAHPQSELKPDTLLNEGKSFFRFISLYFSYLSCRLPGCLSNVHLPLWRRLCVVFLTRWHALALVTASNASHRSRMLSCDCYLQSHFLLQRRR
jgi:hypothetical protein